MTYDSRIAPQELIQSDFRNLRGKEQLDTTPRIEELIFMQSLEGRAHNGAGAFHKRFYVNTSIDDIVKALGKDPRAIKQRRQELIDEITGFVRAVLDGRHPDKLVSQQGTPFLGIPLFTTRTVNPHDILKGLYLGGLRDDARIRQAAEEKYKMTIGYGQCYLINVEVMERMGLDGEILAHQEHESSIEQFTEDGLIVASNDADRMPQEQIKYFYIRHKLGPGQSDDAAIVSAGLRYHNVDIALGVFLADAVDTLEKYVPSYSDQDGELGFLIRDNVKELGITIDQVYELTYLSAIPEGREEETPDSSLRYLLAIDSRTGQSALESHINFIEGKPFFPMAISYNRIITTAFYDYIKERLSGFMKPGELEAFAVDKGLDMPIRDLARKKVMCVPSGASIKKVFDELKETEAEMIVIQDDKGVIVGTVTPKTIFQMMGARA